MFDCGQYLDEIIYYFFGDGDYVVVIGWLNMIQMVIYDGWMGIVFLGKKIMMRLLDFWWLENGKICENWVMVDILDVYCQLGVDVFVWLCEFNKVCV